MFAFWLSIAIVLTNSYKGIVISFLTSPWALSPDWHHLNQLENFTLRGRGAAMADYQYWTAWIRCLRYTTVKECYQQMSGASPFGTAVIQYQNALSVTPTATSFTAERNMAANFTEFLNRLISLAPNETEFMMEDLGTCRNVAYLAWNRELDELMSRLNEKCPRIQFFKGRDNLLAKAQNWVFTNILYTTPQARLKAFLSGGIYDYWKYWLHGREIEAGARFTRVNGSSASALSLNSNVTFVFFIMIMGSCMAFAAFLIEQCKRVKGITLHQRKTKIVLLR
jgi:hypothetical protein